LFCCDAQIEKVSKEEVWERAKDFSPVWRRGLGGGLAKRGKMKKGNSAGQNRKDKEEGR
jgi:hypothetical protein